MDINIQIKPSLASFSAKHKPFDLNLLLRSSLQSNGVPYLICLLILFLVSIIVEFGIGLTMKNFHLMVDSLHNFLNVLALAFSLVATVLSKMPNNQRFTYGYSRLEIIASFANCCFLVFLSLFLVFRGIHDVLESLNEGGHNHESSPQQYDFLLTFNGIRLIINLLGCFSFCRFSSINSSQISSSPIGLFERWYSIFNTKKYKKYEDISQTSVESFSHKGLGGSHHINFHSVYVHFLIGVFVTGTYISIHSIELLHETNFEVLFAICLLVYTIRKTKPIFTLATDILLQALPSSHEDKIEELLETISSIEGVKSVNSARYWALSPNYLIICLDLTLNTMLFKPQVENQTKEILQEYFTEILIQVKAA